VKAFKDTTGRTWRVNITIGSAKRVRDLLGVSLLSPLTGDPPLVSRLTVDALTQAEVLWALCEPDAADEGIAEDAFYGYLVGPTLDQAVKALMEELADFFRRLRRDAIADEIDAQMARVAAVMAIATSGQPSGDSPASSESTPAP